MKCQMNMNIFFLLVWHCDWRLFSCAYFYKWMWFVGVAYLVVRIKHTCRVLHTPSCTTKIRRERNAGRDFFLWFTSCSVHWNVSPRDQMKFILITIIWRFDCFKIWWTYLYMGKRKHTTKQHIIMKAHIFFIVIIFIDVLHTAIP